MENMFQKALKNKFRYKTSVGNLSTEQLFDLGLRELNSIYVELEKQVEKSTGLLSTKSSSSKIVEDKMEVVREIFSAKKEEIELKEKAAANQELKKRILEKIEEKKLGELDEKGIDELEKMAAKL